jgi:hypothetical protein
VEGARRSAGPDHRHRVAADLPGQRRAPDDQAGRPHQVVHFKFAGKVGDQRTVTITGSTFSGCPGLVVSFVRPNGTVLSTKSTCNSNLTLGPSTLDAAGTWEILVDPQGPANGTLIIKVT